jgi:hypothetical protein
MRYLIIVLFILTSCGARKKTTTSEVVRNDTIVVTKDRIITRAVIDSIIIEAPCDSLGILKPFKQRLVTPQGSITIESKKNRIEAKINLDSIVQSIEKTYKSKTLVDVKEVEVIKHRIPAWFLVAGALSLLLNFLLIRK